MTQPASESGASTGLDTSPARGRWLTLANALTLLRLASAPLCALSILAGLPAQALAVFTFAVATDLVDGPLARRLGEASSLGALLDHATDALFVSLGLAAVAAVGLVSPLLPALVLLAFAQYTLDSRALQGRRLRTSQLGRWNGIAYYVLLGVPVVRDGLGLGWPADAWVRNAGWVLVAATLVSMAERGRVWLAQRS
jgi:phosphatidylglycerophosphate synthase